MHNLEEEACLKEHYSYCADDVYCRGGLAFPPDKGGVKDGGHEQQNGRDIGQGDDYSGTGPVLNLEEDAGDDEKCCQKG